MSAGMARPIRNTSLILAAALLAGCSNSGSSSGAPPSGGGTPLTSAGAPTTTPAAANGGPAAAGKPGEEIAAVKETLTRLSKEKTVAGMAPYLSNRSAAALGTIMLIPLEMGAAFAEMGQQFANLGNQKSAPPKPDPKLEQLKSLKTDIDGVLKKYGMDKRTASGSGGDAKAVESQGRAFLTDMGALIDKVSKAGGDKGTGAKPGDVVKNVDDFDYQVVSPTEVKLIPKKKGKGDTMARAIVEDGAWRLDFAGFDDMKKGMGNAFNPGAMGGPPDRSFGAPGSPSGAPKP